MIDTTLNTSTLAERLREQIRSEGPMLFSDWMRAALYDQQEGYYCRDDRIRWGRGGDYRTSPERSSLFAATFARYFASLYETLGRPATWIIAEAGAGEGHFAEGVLQTLQRWFPDVFRATSYVIDEFSAESRALARERLALFGGRVEFDDLGETEIRSGVVFSNELFDAFPVHLLKMQASQLRELYVDVDTNGDFTWLLGAMSEDSSRVLQSFERHGIELGEGQILEVNVEVENWLRKVSAKMTNGYLVTVDYGVDTPGSADQIGSLRGFWRHQFVEDLLARPGEHDLTTNVDWDSVKSVGMGLGLEVTQFERLDRFLLAAGCLEQLVLESQACENDAERLRLSTAAREMILPDGMASHFQVLVQRKSHNL